jgi:hypothetical protein
MANIKENKKYHFTYRTTNLINGRYYLGMHSTNRIDDGYLGSGKRLYYELNKYGRNNFKFEILEQFNSREELVQAEINLITEQDLKNPNCLNLKQGGSGGFTDENRKKARQVTDRVLEEKYGKDFRAIVGKQYYENSSEEQKQERNALISRRLKEVKFNHATFKGKKHTEETLNKMKNAKIGHGKGVENSQFGTCWITNEVENKKINKNTLIPEGWRLGRKRN